MKKILFLLLIPFLLYGQVERSVYGSVQRITNTRDLETEVTNGKFDGSTNYVSVPDNANLTFGSSFTIELFFKTDDQNNLQLLIKGVGSSDREYAISIDNTSKKLIVDFFSGGTTANFTRYYTVNNTILPNNIYHVILSYTSGTLTYYLNGVSVATNPTNVGTGFSGFLDGSANIETGRYNSSIYSSGKVFFTRLHNRALSASEVLSYYNNGRPDLYIIPYSDRWGSQTDVASGALVVGKKYVVVGGTSIVHATVTYVAGTVFTASATTYTETAGTEQVYAVGVVADYRFNEGAGYQVKDYSANKLHGVLNGTYDGFWQNSKQFFSKEFNLADDAISATTATTTLFKLPANIKVLSMVAEVDTAFNTDNTLSIGTSSTDTWLGTITATNSTGAATANINKTYSSDTEIQLYIKKAGASTAGRVRLTFQFENLNYVPTTN